MALTTRTKSHFYPQRACTLSFIIVEKRMGINAGTQGTRAQNVFLILSFSLSGALKKLPLFVGRERSGARLFFSLLLPTDAGGAGASLHDELHASVSAGRTKRRTRWRRRSRRRRRNGGVLLIQK